MIDVCVYVAIHNNTYVHMYVEFVMALHYIFCA